MIDSLLQQVRYALRRLVRSPLFTSTAVASLAIGIGANVAIFNAANALLLAPTAGVRDAGRLIDIGRTTGNSGFDTVSYPTFADLRDRAATLDGVFAIRFEPQPMSFGGGDQAVRVYAQQVSAGYFDVLGVVPAAGAFFRSAEERVGAPLRKAVLSHAFWRRHFGLRPSIVGEPIALNGDSFVVSGIAPEGFRGSTVLAPDLWVPLTAHARAMPTAETLRERQNVSLLIGARLKPGVTLSQAQAELDAVMRELTESYPDLYRQRGLRAAPASRLPGAGTAIVLPFLGVLMGIVGLVLLVACANLAGLLLSRAVDRSREIAVRLALGAPRRAIVGLGLSETMLVFAAGAGAGWLLSLLLGRLLAATLTAVPLPVSLDLSPDWRVLAFAAALTLAASLVTGLAPALHGVGRSLTRELRAEARATPARQRLRRAFIAAQLAFCLVLVATAGLFVRALAAAATVDPGMRVGGIHVASIDLALGGYERDRVAAAAGDIRDRLAAIPGVEAAGVAAMIPLNGGGLGLGALRLQGTTDPSRTIRADWNVISPEWLSTVDVPLVRGRHFTDADRAGAPEVAIVNERFAAAEWPGRDPVGQVLENGSFRPGQESSLRRLTVVGVVGDSKYRWLGEGPRHFIYVPLAQNPMPSLHFFLRTPDDAIPMAPAVRHALAAFDPALPLVELAPLATYASLGLLPQRLAASLAGSLGAVALLLAAIGVYGVTAFAVATRTREIGVRMALGADARRVVADVLVQGARLTAVGTALGLFGALAVTHLLSGLLFGVSPVDPLAFAAATAALGGVGVVSTYLPARRAARIDPIAALRAE